MAALTQAVLIVSVGLSLVLAAYGLRQRPRPGALAFAAFSVGTAIWAGGVLGASISETVAASVLWTRFEYVGIVTVPAAWFVVAARYTGNDELLTRRRIAAAVAISTTTLLLMWTTDVHGQFYADVFPDQRMISGFGVDHGPLYYAWVVVGYGLVVGACALLARMLYEKQEVYRKQAAATLVAATGPLASNVAYNVGLTTSDLTSAAFAVSGLAIGWAMHRFEFMDVTPVARETVVDNIRDGVLVLDDRERVVDANPAARRLLGVTDDRTLVGRPAVDALDEPFDALPERFADVTRASDLVTFDTARGKRFLEVDVRPYEDGGGHERGRLFYLHDVTERERRERELERQNEQLDRFASLVSHDLRNPLNVAEGYVENAKTTGEVADLAEVEVAHERMRAIIDDVLELARNGRTVTDAEPVDVGAVAQRAWASVDTRDATLVVESTVTLVAAESRLQGLFENLFRNAVDHGGNDVTVTVGDSENGFFVADDGPGIRERERDKVLDDGYTTHAEGTGLGLSIVTSVANAHEWTVAVEESDDGGARFSFTGTTFARDDPGTPLASD